MAKIDQGDFEEVFKIRRTEGDGVDIPGVLHYKNESNEDILVFQNNTIYLPPDYKEVIDLYSYNLSKKELMWKVEDVSEESWNFYLPQKDDENIYFATRNRMFSFDIETGAKNWERLEPYINGSNYLLHNDLLITNLGDGGLIAISKHTGETVWHNEELSYCCAYLRIYNDKIYFGESDMLFIVDANSGELLHRYKSSTRKEKGRSNAHLYKSIAVDTENQRIYATDGYYLMCLKHPDL